MAMEEVGLGFRATKDLDVVLQIEALNKSFVESFWQLDDDYYTFLHAGKQIINDIPVLRPEHLIPLKAKAWIDLAERRKKGASIDSRVIRKHKNDVFRVYQIIEPDYKFTIPSSIKEDLRFFIESMRTESINLKTLGLVQADLNDLLDELGSIYGIF